MRKLKEIDVHLIFCCIHGSLFFVFHEAIEKKKNGAD